jgi:hypothetical protein
MTKLRVSFLASVLVGLLASAGALVPAGADAAKVTVRLNVAVAPQVVWAGLPVTVKACNVSVPTGASGEAVLVAATASGCIRSYEVDNSRVVCVNNFCQGAATWWGAYLDDEGVLTCWGGVTLDQFYAAPGATLYLKYMNWMLC